MGLLRKVTHSTRNCPVCGGLLRVTVKSKLFHPDVFYGAHVEVEKEDAPDCCVAKMISTMLEFLETEEEG